MEPRNEVWRGLISQDTYRVIERFNDYGPFFTVEKCYDEEQDDWVEVKVNRIERTWAIEAALSYILEEKRWMAENYR